MKIERLTLRSIKVVGTREDLTFGSGLCVVYGPNRSGKTTLVRVLYAALLHRPTPTLGQALAAPGGGTPEVTVRLATDEGPVEVTKVFGARGVTRLRVAAGAECKGDEALRRLAEIVGDVIDNAKAASPVTRHRVAAASVRMPHRWVFHGFAGDEEAFWPEAPMQALARRVAASADAVAEDDRDRALRAKVEARLSELCGVSVRGGRPHPADPERPLRGSALEAARSEMEAAEAAVADLAATVEAIQALAATVADGRAALERLAAEREAATEQRRRAAARLDTIQTVTVEVERLEAERALRAGRCERLAAYVANLSRCAQLRAALVQNEQTLADARAQAERAAAALDEARRAVEGARLTFEVVEAAAEWARLREALAALDAQAAARADTAAKVAAHERELAALPPVDRATLDRLADLDRQVGVARARLDALAAEVELRADPDGAGVRVGGAALEIGAPVPVHDEVDVVVGDRIVLRVRAGSKDQRAEAGKTLAACEDAIARTLAEVGVASLEEARAAERARARVEAALGSLRGQLARAPSPEALASRRATLLEGAGKAKDRLEAARERLAQLGEVASLEEDRSIEGAAAADLDALRDEHRARVEAAREALARAEQAHEQARARAEAAAAEVTRVREDLRAVEARLDQARAHDPALPAAAEAAETALATLREDLARLDEALARARARLGGETKTDLEGRIEALDRRRAELDARIEAQRSAIDEARGEIRARTRAREEGTLDERLADAKARLAAARARLRRVATEVFACEILRETYDEARKTLAQSVDRHLGGRIQAYLDRPFPGVQVAFRSETDGRAVERRLRVHLPGDPEAFDHTHWSAGTAEQVGVAIRLALCEAEATAQASGSFLVLDDPFSNTDAGTMRGIRAMLAAAVQANVQIIVCTCRPEAYLGHGELGEVTAVDLGAPARG